MRRELVYRDEIMDSLVKEYNRKRTNDGLKLAWIEKAVNDVKPAELATNLQPTCNTDLPDNNVGDMISRSSLLEKYDKEHEGPPGRARKLIEEEPPVHTKIIYCKDCRHRDDYGCCKYWRGLAMSETPIATDDYDFCNHARRREREH